MKQYRKKPVVIEAVQFTDNHDEIVRWIVEGAALAALNQYSQVEISTLEGIMTAFPGDWIIKGTQGEFYPCKPDIFEETYEEVSDEKD